MEQTDEIAALYKDVSQDYGVSKKDFGQFFKYTLYGMPQTIVNQSNNEATEVEVIDNNGIQNAENNDNIKEGIVGRINDPSNALQ